MCNQHASEGRSPRLRVLHRKPVRAVAYALLAAFFVLALPSHPVRAEKVPDAGTVRVLLTTYQNQTQLQIEVYGSYTLNESLSFQRGSKLTVLLVNQQLQVHYGGMSYTAGTEIRLKRFSVPEGLENGLRLDGQAALFPGDFILGIQDGRFFPVTVLPVEEYLQGVVPYEMADEFPLEALKAQAIAARTYTLAGLKPDRAYDLVDNTNDQVYRGINLAKANARQAVIETTGIVCLYQGKLANCLYTASNGGFSESALNAWGREQIPYLKIQADRYDLENPLSIVRTALIHKDLGGQLNTESSLLKDYLYARLQPRIDGLGYDATKTQYRIAGITGITPHTAKYGGEQGVMSQLRFDLTVHVTHPDNKKQDSEVHLSQPSDNQTAAGEEKDQSVDMVTSTHQISIDCPVFPDIEQLLSLSINRNENEIVSVLNQDQGFHIRFARYGHGVGMSQRGAEWMARQYNWTYEQILRFYYPGTTLFQAGTAVKELPPLDMQFSTTPGPAPTATPRPTLMPQSRKPDGQHILVYVTGIAKDSSLNLRAQPDILADIKTRLYYGQELLLIEELENGWMKVETDVASGYVRHEYISREKDQAP